MTGWVVADFLDQKREEIRVRLQELAPLVEEHSRLQAALLALEGIADTPPASAVTPRPRKPSSRTGRRSGRQAAAQGAGTARADQALQAIQTSPGITVKQLAETLGINPNYLYRLLPKLRAQGLITKTADGWHAAGGDQPRPG